MLFSKAHFALCLYEWLNDYQIQLLLHKKNIKPSLSKCDTVAVSTPPVLPFVRRLRELTLSVCNPLATLTLGVWTNTRATWRLYGGNGGGLASACSAGADAALICSKFKVSTRCLSWNCQTVTTERVTSPPPVLSWQFSPQTVKTRMNAFVNDLSRSISLWSLISAPPSFARLPPLCMVCFVHTCNSALGENEPVLKFLPCGEIAHYWSFYSSKNIPKSRWISPMEVWCRYGKAQQPSRCLAFVAGVWITTYINHRSCV